MLNGKQHHCVMCLKAIEQIYAYASEDADEVCSKSCSQGWDALPFDERQRRIDVARGVRPHIVAQAA